MGDTVVSRKSREAVVDQAVLAKCNYPPCLYASYGRDAVYQHISRFHKEDAIEVEPLRAVAMPDFSNGLAVLRCLNCNEFCAGKVSFRTHIYSMHCSWCKIMSKFCCTIFVV